jgi:hypothetical protein
MATFLTKLLKRLDHLAKSKQVPTKFLEVN